MRIKVDEERNYFDKMHNALHVEKEVREFDIEEVNAAIETEISAPVCEIIEGWFKLDAKTAANYLHGAAVLADNIDVFTELFFLRDLLLTKQRIEDGRD